MHERRKSDRPDAIDAAFARWDRAHLSLFELADATDVCGPIQWDDRPRGPGLQRVRAENRDKESATKAQRATGLRG